MTGQPLSETTFQWLIERGQPEGLANAEWLENSAEHPATHRKWTRNALKAAMFPDREMAEQYIAAQRLDARAVEHGFMSAGQPLSEERDGYGRCRSCGGPFSDGSAHIDTCPRKPIPEPSEIDRLRARVVRLEAALRLAQQEIGSERMDRILQEAALRGGGREQDVNTPEGGDPEGYH